MPRRGLSIQNPIRAVFAIVASLFVAVQMLSPLFLVLALIATPLVVFVLVHKHRQRLASRNEPAGLPFPLETRKRKGYRPDLPSTDPVPMMSLPVVAPTHRPKPQAFSEEVFLRMDWLVFERFCVGLFEELDFQARKTGAGADGGVDIELRGKNDPISAAPKALVQCKARSQALVGVDKARELYGVVCARNVPRGILLCNTAFTDEAKNFARGVPKLLLGDLAWIQKQIDRLSESRRSLLESRYLAADFDVPSCPQCEVKMVRRDGKKGPFWGCINYPRGCRSMLHWRSVDG